MRFAALGLAFLPPILLASTGCVKSRPLLVRNAFAASYWCPVNQIEVRPEPGSEDRYHVTGCGQEVTYDCSAGGAPGDCKARIRVEYEATDGTSHGAWQEEEAASNNAMAREAALASAAHDLPCDRASIQIVGGGDPNGFANVVEGCGQRVTYQIADVAGEATATPSDAVKKRKYVVLTRTAIAAPPVSAAPQAPAAPAHSASVAPPPPPASAAPAPATPAPAPPASASPLTTPR